eukprot:3907949-Pyramimonas_sp.AAC.1
MAALLETPHPSWHQNRDGGHGLPAEPDARGHYEPLEPDLCRAHDLGPRCSSVKKSCDNLLSKLAIPRLDQTGFPIVPGFGRLKLFPSWPA